MERSRELNWSKPAVVAWLRWAGLSPNTRYGSMLMDAFVAGHTAGSSAPSSTVDADLAAEIDQLRDALDTAQNKLLVLSRSSAQTASRTSAETSSGA